MVPLALGNQTGGSTIRPAAFCGVVGYKPTFNLVNRAGMKPLAESQDTVGLLARSVPDAALALSILCGCAMPDFRRKRAAPRLAICRLAAWPALEPAMAGAMERAASDLARGGASVKTLDLPQAFADALHAQRTMNDYEAFRALTDERLRHWDLLSTSLQERLTNAAQCTYDEYVKARDVIRRCRALLADLFREHDALLTPSAPGIAPKGLTNTGDSNFIRIWTSFHTPTLNLPVFRGEHDLPMGLQVIGPIGEDIATLCIAEWLQRALS
jgi:Asp-tRNA(Asn)/Glu-tRNA(Gln) amidotransferase A subunit family amidase